MFSKVNLMAKLSFSLQMDILQAVFSATNDGEWVQTNSK